MQTFKEDCPHCGTKSVAFTILKESGGQLGSLYVWDTLAKCGHCSRSVLACFLTSNPTSPTKLTWHERHTIRELTIYPLKPSVGAPDHTPLNVAEFYRQGMDSLPGNCDAAGAMFRKTLETGLKARFPGIKGKLYSRIQQAEKEGGLTPELAKWAHQIRLDGNDAIHDEDPYSKEEIDRLHTFTHLVLLYLFTLPGMLAEAQGGSANGDED